MKKTISFIVALLSLSACTMYTPPSSEPQSNPGFQEPPSVSINPTYSPLEGQINRPNKQFNVKVEKDADVDYVNALDQFALEYYNLLNNEENQVFSPLSIATCYSMLYEGTDGTTRQEIENMLHYDDSFNHIEEIKNMLLKCAINDEEKGTYLDIAQSVWTRNKDIFQQEYIDKLTNDYYAEAFDNINFATTGKQLCADWVNGKTNNFLNVTANDFASFNGLTVMVLFNTIYLKSSWANEKLFDEDNNREAEFNNRDGSKSTVTYMNGRYRDAAFYNTSKYKISSLPYNNGITLNVLLPKEDYANVLKDSGALDKLIHFNKLPSAEIDHDDVVWTLPKFKMQTSYNLIALLGQLGLHETFSGIPNLSRMISPDYRNNIYVEKSVHVAGIEMSNKGVEAAAYTYIQMDEKSATEPVRMTIDHPFAYSITTEDGYPLFMGVVNQL